MTRPSPYARPFERLLHPPACDGCGGPCLYGARAGEDEASGRRFCVVCWTLAHVGLRAARALGAGIAAACAGGEA